MAKFRLSKRAQSTLEYAVLIGVLVAALLAMQVYLKRGYQGKLRESADQMGEQFSPGHTTYNYTVNSTTNSTETLNADATTKTDIHKQETTKTGNEHVDQANSEQWW